VSLRFQIPERVRPYLVDLLIATLTLAISLVPFVIPRATDPGPFSPLAWLALVGANLPLVWRRRFPILCLLTVWGFMLYYNTLHHGVAPEPVGWPLLVALYSVAWLGRPWQQAICVTLVTISAAMTLRSHTTVVIGVLTGLGAGVLGWMARARERHIKELAYRAGQAERDRETAAAQAVATERARIARDMHDVLAHAVSLMVVQAEAGPVVVRTAPERAERAFDAIAEAGRDAMVQLRRSLGILKEEQDRAVRAPQPTVAAISTLVAQVEQTGLTTSLEVSGAPRNLAPDTEVAAFRIVQEALTNTLKHAAATTVKVALTWERSALRIAVRDDGRGGGDLGGGGHGLIGIRERAASCGGTASGGPLARGGFEVTATLPVVAR
jgi:signal transduction histidine kinase